ncbi:IS3 family transposase [Kocuria sp. cx-455]|nr:IS3 family transposase [Kocuria sp. cx-455]
MVSPRSIRASTSRRCPSSYFRSTVTTSVATTTRIQAWQGWLYLATVIDAHSRRVIGWAIDEHMRADLVEDALQMAITLRGERPAKVVFHADRGTQYASEQISRFADENGITRSMGRTGVCWDNAMAESFFATLKTEFYYRRVWSTNNGAKVAIEDRYDPRRRHSAIGQNSPVEFEMQHCNQTADPQQAA